MNIQQPIYVLPVFIFCAAVCTVFSQEAGFSVSFPPDFENPDAVYERALLGDCIIHMKKITDAFRGSAPAIELLAESHIVWESTGIADGWGKPGCTFRYYEKTVPGTPVFFSVTNKLNDVYYYKTVAVHPCALPLYEKPAEAQMLERFIFFKFTAYADKGGLFENYLDNYLYALDTHTKLLYSYGMPADYKKVPGNNYIPLNWMPYETALHTKQAGLKFYEYDPVGFVSIEHSCEFFKIKTNIHIYDWWYASITAGKNTEEIKARRYLPVVNPAAEKDWTVRDINRPVASPYRR